MNCAQCGAELDRLSKWRGSPDHCSEECRRKSQEEFDRLAMKRLMQPRQQRTAAGRRPAPVADGGVAVAEPAEPPWAGFIMEAAATLSGGNVRRQTPVLPRALSPFIPDPGLSTADPLLALHGILTGSRPALRAARACLDSTAGSMAIPGPVAPGLVLPVCEPVWQDQLGLAFRVAGFDEGRSQAPVVHRSIPPRRGARSLTSEWTPLAGGERPAPLPTVSSPRLRIHLPKPLLQPFRPRYCFAAAPEARVPAAAEKEAVSAPAPLSEQNTAPAAAAKAAPAAMHPETAPGHVEEPLAIPTFGGNAAPAADTAWSRIPGLAKACALLAVVIAVIGWWTLPALQRRSETGSFRPAAAGAPPAAMGVESWETRAATDETGDARHRRISLYRPARGKRDYTLDFTGQIEQRAIGWVFRHKDSDNYYCLKLEQTGEGQTAGVQLVKFAVVNGKEQPHRLVPLRQTLATGTAVSVRLEVKGQSFSTTVNGTPVDVWIDNQIGEGTAGFSNEDGERAVIGRVRVSY